MQPTRRRPWLAILAAPPVLLVAACSSGFAPSAEPAAWRGTSASGGAFGGIFRLGIVEPAAIDPYNAQETEGSLVTRHLFTGLVTLDPETAELRPGVAKTWSQDGDCTEWTFNLRQGTRFSNGEEVTARSFIRGMTRAAAQSAASDVAYHMAGIAGYAELHGTGEGAVPGTATEFSGLSAPDPHTLVVRLSEPDCEFDRKTLQPVMSPVPEVAGDAANQHYNDLPVGNGPFKMKEPWQHDESITLVRNDTYFGPRPFLDEVRLAILPTQGAIEAEYRGVQAGQFDYGRIPPTFLPQAKAIFERRGGFISQATMGINHLVPNVANPPLDSADARKAVSLAIDRSAIAEGVFKGFQSAATSLIPPPLEAYHQPGVCDACGPPDLPRARELAARAGLRPGTKLSLAYNTGAGHDAWVQAVGRQLEENLGLDVDLQPFPFAELLERESAGDATGLFRAGWTADYPSAENFLFPLLSRRSLPPGDNRGRYVNDRFDDLLVRARRTPVEAERARLIKEAERIAIGEDLALIPLWYRHASRVFDASRWTGVRINFFEEPDLVRIRRK